MTCRISVIVPIYNVAAYLPRCLDSLLSQTLTDFQLILVNDGSTDHCGEICDSYAARDPRITVIHKENGGLSSARNAGLEKAEGEFISFVDSDDWLHPQFLELMFHFQQTGDYDLVICDHRRVTGPVPSPTFAAAEICAQELNLEGIYRQHRTKTYVWNKLYRRSLIGNHRFIEQKIAEDAAFNGIALGSCPHIRACFLPAVLYYYFYREGSLVTQLDASNRLALAEIFDTYAAAAATPGVRRLYAKEILKTSLSARYRYHFCGFDPSNRQLCRRLMKSGLAHLWRSPGRPVWEPLLYTGLCCFPGIYRMLRLREDPTLFAWEKQQRIGRRSASRQ